ncbi:zinc-binding dehydrogenase [Amycolatopsis oliviviridis]|uniref:Dehydrogenase n=1 Tax=Amycolatopsis oliviviridis TaxID=1471590 RepID=A0ABQ3M6X2_9PSEU|nr:zinc-binding dehydrogenase [Amycolatopsis oliviviridis]GHH28450.1 dehydrogenase [Amycolatopsis oliviviridis]
MTATGADGRLPATMRAVRFDSVTGDLSLQEVPVRAPDVDEVVVKIAACGICNSDLDRIDGRVTPVLPVFTPGHEAAGVVVAVGERVSLWAPGDRVVLAAGRECGHCAECRVGGGPDDCADPHLMAVHCDGAWAEYVTTSATALVGVPDSIPLEQATVLSGSVSTPYGAIDTARLRPAEAVGVWGLGALGTHLVQLARICGASPIIALDPRPVARERALGRGADVALDPANRQVTSYIKEITKGRGLDVAFDLVGCPSTFGQAREVLRKRGRLVMVSASPDTQEVGRELPLARNDQIVVGHTGYRVTHLEGVVELMERGRLDIDGSISAILPLEQVIEGVRRMREHDDAPIRVLLRP